jgi:hypothetical protein
MTKYLRLQVPSPCSENWQHMTPDASGRFCSSCRKTVVDFSQMTDAELQRYFKTYSGSTCGRFSASQLNRNILAPKKPMPWARYFFRFALPAFLLSLKASAQPVRRMPSIEIAPTEPKGQLQHFDRIPPEPIQGTIIDERGHPVQHASVCIKGTRIGTTTDSLGRFHLQASASNAILIVSYIGYQTIEVPAAAKNITLTVNHAMLGEVVVIGYATKKKAVKNVRREVPKSEATPVATLLVYPNPAPAGTVINVKGNYLEKGDYRLEWYALSGQLIHTPITATWDGHTPMAAPAVELPGTYWLKVVHTASGKQLSQQVLVQ